MRTSQQEFLLNQLICSGWRQLSISYLLVLQGPKSWSVRGWLKFLPALVLFCLALPARVLLNKNCMSIRALYYRFRLHRPHVCMCASQMRFRPRCCQTVLPFLAPFLPLFSAILATFSSPPLLLMLPQLFPFQGGIKGRRARGELGSRMLDRMQWKGALSRLFWYTEERKRFVFLADRHRQKCHALESG